MKDTVVLRGGHSSGQFSDTEKQQTADAHRLAKKMRDLELHFLTGTEAGSKSVLAEAWRGIDQKFGLQFRKGRSGDQWLVHRIDLFEGKVTQEWHKILDGVSGKFADRGYVTAGGHSPLVGSDLTIMASHWLTDPTDHNRPDGPGNARLSAAATVLGREYGKKHDLCFLGLDANRSEREPGGLVLDAPFISLAQDTGKILNTGHGAIDGLCRYENDRRVHGLTWDVLDDSEFRLASDHYFCYGSWEVRIPA